MESDQPIRRCRKCGEDKTLADFPVYDPRSGARRHECRECNVARVDGWHRDNVERLRAKRRENYRADPKAFWTPQRRKRANEVARARNTVLRDKVLAIYGEQCACCGEAERRFLTIDHVNNDGKEMRKVHGTGGSLYKWLMKNNGPAGFQTLCMNCNFGKAMNKGTCPHQVKEGSTTIPQGSTAKRPEVPRTLAAEIADGS